MNRHEDETFSAIIDGELEHKELSDTFRKMCQDEDRKDCWQRYHLIRDALRSNLPNKINFNFSRSILAALESEPTVLAPVSLSNKLTMTPITKRIVGAAIAASVAIIAVVGVQSTYKPAFQPEKVQQMASMPSDSEFARLPSSEVTIADGTIANVTIAANVTPNVTRIDNSTIHVMSSFPNSKIPLAVSHESFPNLQKYIVDHNQRVLSSPIQGIMPYARIVISRSPTRGQIQR